MSIVLFVFTSSLALYLTRLISASLLIFSGRENVPSLRNSHVGVSWVAFIKNLAVYMTSTLLSPSNV